MATSASLSMTSGIDWDKVRIFYIAAEAGSFTHAGDVLIGISTSGNSQTIVNAATVARELGMKVIILTGTGDHFIETVDEDETTDLRKLAGDGVHEVQCESGERCHRT